MTFHGYGPTASQNPDTAQNENVISCTSSTGVGANHRFVVTRFDGGGVGQSSGVPTDAASAQNSRSYKPPILRTMAKESGSLSALPTTGGDSITFTGDFFGPNTTLGSSGSSANIQAELGPFATTSCRQASAHAGRRTSRPEC